MIVWWRVFTAVLLLYFRKITAKEIEVLPGTLQNDFPAKNNWFTVQSPLSADQIVAQALEKETQYSIETLDDDIKTDTDDEEDKEQIKNAINLSDSTNKKTRAKDQSQSETKVVSQSNDKDYDKLAALKKQYKGKKGHKSAKFGEKKGHKKGHKTKGYNNRFQKDEYHKEHKLYGDGHRHNHKNNYEDVYMRLAKSDNGYNRSKLKTHSQTDTKFDKQGTDDTGKFSDRHKDFDTRKGHATKNKHKTHAIKIKDERNPYPNHRPYKK